MLARSISSEGYLRYLALCLGSSVRLSVSQFVIQFVSLCVSIFVTNPTQPQLNSKVGFDMKMTLDHRHHQGGEKYFTSWEPRFLGKHFAQDSVIHGPSGALLNLIFNGSRGFIAQEINSCHKKSIFVKRNQFLSQEIISCKLPSFG